MSGQPFSEAVAERSQRSVDRVEAVLQRNGIVADPTPPRARRLRISRIMFAGEKVLHNESKPFRFERENMGDGLWIIASEDNLVGKTSTLQIILWALRGAPKSLAPDVRHWLSRVEIEFYADSRLVKVHFAVADGVPSGSVSVEGESESQQFANDEAFKRVMQDNMLRLLSLEPIPATRQPRGDADLIRYEDGWLAYTGALLSDARSDAIIGENIPGTNITQRLLQVFLGIPYATTHFQARAANRVLEVEAARRKQKASSLGGRTVAEMESEVASIVLQIEDEASRSAAVAELQTTQRRLDTLQSRISDLRLRLSEFEALVEERKDAKIRADRVVLDVQEESRSSAFFKRLDPVECPRCSTAITDERRGLEATHSQCAVCATVATAPNVHTDVEQAEAESDVADAAKRLGDAEEARKQTQSRLAQLIAEREVVADSLARQSRLGTAVDLQVLERRRERVEGMLEVARAVMGEQSEVDDSLEIVATAEREAEARTKQAAELVLDRASKEITRIFKALGVSAADDVRLDRAAHARVTKGGQVISYGYLSDGEQLRLRIATVLALMHTAKEHASGRHPGLLMIDSPGNAEMKGENVAEAIREIAAVVHDVANVQIFVGMRNVELARQLAPSERVIAAGEGEALW